MRDSSGANLGRKLRSGRRSVGGPVCDASSKLNTHLLPCEVGVGLGIFLFIFFFFKLGYVVTSEMCILS